MTIEQMRKRRGELVAEAEKLNALTEGEHGQELTEEQQARFDACLAEIAALDKSIDRAVRLAGVRDAETQGVGRVSAPDAPVATPDDPMPAALPAGSGNGTSRNKPATTVHPPRSVEAPYAGFASMGDYYQAVYHAGMASGARTDERLRPLVSSMTLADGAGGGFMLPGTAAQDIWTAMMGDAQNLLNLTASFPVAGESLPLPRVEETSRATGYRFGGVQGYWLAESSAITAKKPKLGTCKIEPEGLCALVRVSDRLLRVGGAALAQFLRVAAGSELTYMINDAIVNGNGTGKPMGILHQGLKTIAKETSQAAATVLHANIRKMWAGMPGRWRGNSVWLASDDVLPQLQSLVIPVLNVAGTENVGGVATGVFNDQTGQLNGRPVIFTEACQVLGTLGDIILWAPMSYMSGYRTLGPGGIEEAMSIHVRFDYAETAFRYITEVDGQPYLTSEITRAKGSDTMSTQVALATRS